MKFWQSMKWWVNRSGRMAYGGSQGENYSYLCSLVGMEDRAAFQVALRHESWKEMKWLEPSEPQPLPPSNIWHKSQFLNIKRRGKDLFWEFCRNVAGSNKYLKKFRSGSRAIQCVISPSFWLSEPDFGEYFRGNFKSLSDMRYPILHQHLTGGDDEAGSGLKTEDWLLSSDNIERERASEAWPGGPVTRPAPVMLIAVIVIIHDHDSECSSCDNFHSIR